MKKLLLVLTVMFAFVTITFANTKPSKEKQVIKKEVNIVSPEINKIDHNCIAIFDVSYWQAGVVVHEKLIIIDWQCVLTVASF
jgi:hypothetical protein